LIVKTSFVFFDAGFFPDPFLFAESKLTTAGCFTNFSRNLPLLAVLPTRKLTTAGCFTNLIVERIHSLFSILFYFTAPALPFTFSP